MAKPRRAVMLAFGLLFAQPAVASDAAADPPKIGRPQPAPNTQPDIPPLPPAYFDPTLAVGGDDLKARKIETRLSVAVQVNGRGPYHFIVDSGADTSAVGLRIARDLQLPLGTPAILNGMTSRNLVDRVKVDQLTLGPTVVRDLEVPALREIDLGGDGLLVVRIVGPAQDGELLLAGDLALATCAWGGVYFSGSVATAWSTVADVAQFRAEFTRKGPMQTRMRQIPTAVIRRENAALFGLAMMPLADH